MPTLPREIWLLVFVLCPDVQTAVRLSATNKEIQQIWQDKQGHIVNTILAQDIPVYEDAARVARLESQIALLAKDTNSTTTAMNCKTQGINPSIREWLPRLLKNAQLALRVCVEWEDWLSDETMAQFYRVEVNLTSPTVPSGHEAFYFFLELAASFELLELRRGLTRKLETCPLDELRTHHAFYVFVYLHLDENVVESMGIGRDTPFDEWSSQDQFDDLWAKPRWEYATNLVEEMLKLRAYGHPITEQFLRMYGNPFLEDSCDSCPALT